MPNSMPTTEDIQQGQSLATLHVIAERTRQFTFPNLRRPPIPPNRPATQELVSWGVQVYCFSWMRHLSTLVNGVITLKDAGNMPSTRIMARSVFELGAHAYYTKKHLRQHLGRQEKVRKTAPWLCRCPGRHPFWNASGLSASVGPASRMSAKTDRADRVESLAKHIGEILQYLGQLQKGGPFVQTQGVADDEQHENRTEVHRQFPDA